jgi:hypothetical protein
MRYPTLDDLPAGVDGGAGRTFARFRTLTAMFSDRRRYAPDEIVSMHATIRFVNHDIPIRTLWHVLYEPAAAAMTVSFHVRDGEFGEVRSPQMRFSLAPKMPAQSASMPLKVPQISREFTVVFGKAT